MGIPNQIRIELFRQMIRAQVAENSILRLIDAGKAQVLYHSARGQEAVSAGAMLALRNDDSMFYGHRGVGHLLTKGVNPTLIFGDILGTTAGSTGGLGAGIVHVVDPSVGVLGQSGTVGGTFPLAAGVALAAHYRGTDQVVLCMFGDGTANRGTFHEAANAVGAWGLPVIWLCENNGYAVSVSQSESTPITDLSIRAAGYGMPCVIVDGQDVELVYAEVLSAVERARQGLGPTFIEAKTVRFRGHFEGDPQNYRTDSDRDFDAIDPIVKQRAKLISEGICTLEATQQIVDECESEMELAIEAALAAPLPSVARAFEGVLS